MGCGASTEQRTDANGKPVQSVHVEALETQQADYTTEAKGDYQAEEPAADYQAPEEPAADYGIN